VWSPVLVALVMWALWLFVRPGVCCERPGLAAMAAATVVPFLEFLLWSPFGPVHPYWTGVALPAACGMVALGLRQLEPDRRRLVWRALAAQLVLIAGVGALVLSRGGGNRDGYIGHRIQWLAEENGRLATRVQSMLAAAGDGALMATSHGYATIFQLEFYLGLPGSSMVLAPRGLAIQFEEWASPDWLGRNAVFVAPGTLESFPLGVYFESCSVPEALELGRNRTYTVTSCEGYRGPAPWLWKPVGDGDAEAHAERLYRALLGRRPDQEGIRSVVGALARGELAHLVWNITRSLEYRERFGDEPPDRTARRIWAGLLGSDPSPDELIEATELLRWAGPHGLTLRLLEDRQGRSSVRVAGELSPDRS